MIYKRGNVYYYDFVVGGRRFNGSTRCRNRKYALAYAARKRSETIAPDGTARSTMSVMEAFETWASANSKRVRSWPSMSGQHDIITEALGPDTCMSKVGTSLVSAVVDKWRAEGASDGTIAYRLGRIKAVRRWVSDRRPDVTMGHLVTPRVKTSRKMRFLQPGEGEALLRAVRGTMRVLALVLMDTGVRLGEALDLRWDAINPDDTITVYRSKTDTVDTVPLSERLKAALEEHRAATPGALVFPGDRADGRLSYDVRALRNAINRAGLNAPEKVKRWGRFTVHSLRHSYGTRMVSAGVPITMVQKLMGHASMTTTMRYVHATDTDAVSRAREVLNADTAVSRQWEK